MDFAHKQILKRAKEQNIDLRNKDIIIPKDENILSLNGTEYTGKIFSNGTACILMNDPCDNDWEEPVIFRIIEEYQTYISTGTMWVLTNFFVVE